MTRVVCIGGAITEIVYALGMDRHVVAVDSSSLYPPAALAAKQSVGYMRRLSPEGVLALRPSLILASEDSGPPEAVEILTASRTPVLFVDNTPTPEAVAGRVRRLAEVFGVPEEGERLCRRIEAEFLDLGAWTRAHPSGKRVGFLLSMQNDRPVVAGHGTAADAIIGLAGGVNVGSAMEGYKPVSDEALTAMAPDVVLVMDHAGPGVTDDVLDHPGLRQTVAGRRRALIRMDGAYLLAFGPRTAAAALDLAQRLAAV
ncbi:MAG: ABC transporter substrate-binding protein [Telmatospirillum sp.]|nr:ABC transporter substrate-binding protein [Telmatospirillum sp.]